jgi:hypothetical protein
MVAKILDQVRKFGWLFAAFVILTIVFLFVRDLRLGAAYKVEKRVFKEKLERAEGEISRLSAERQAWMDKAAENLAAADSQAAKNKDLEAALATKSKENEALKKKIEAMPADDVVAETRIRLSVGAEDVYRNSLGIQFSLAAGRKNLSRLYDADFSLVKEQEFARVIDGQKREIASLRATISDQAGALNAGQGIIVQYEQLKIDYADILKKSERQARWLKFTIGGVAVAIAAGGLYLLFGGKK